MNGFALICGSVVGDLSSIFSIKQKKYNSSWAILFYHDGKWSDATIIAFHCNFHYGSLFWLIHFSWLQLFDGKYCLLGKLNQRAITSTCVHKPIFVVIIIVWVEKIKSTICCDHDYLCWENIPYWINSGVFYVYL